MALRLISSDNSLSFELRPGVALTLGRALSCDLPVLDPTISRKHAEVRAQGEVLSVRDLGSSNGTYVDGKRVSQIDIAAGSRIVFGKVAFEVRSVADQLIDDTTAEMRRRAARAGTTVLRQVPVPDADEALEAALQANGPDAAATLGTQLQRERLKLTLLLEMSKALTRVTSIEALLDKAASFTFRLLGVEHVTIALGDTPEAVTPAIALNHAGQADPRVIAQSLVRTVAEQRVACLADSLEPDSQDEVPRAAICAPLLAGHGRFLGVLYVETATASAQVRDDDLDFFVAFAGIAAVALDNLRYGEHVRREQAVRENFERFFSPHVAEGIASQGTALALGGERRRVAVLFADIRDFTPLSLRLAPDETARLLNEFFSEMVECVFAHGGTLDKFLGDAVMALWGAPMSAPDDADRALEAAQAMLAALRQLNERWHAQGRPTIEVGIGLNYGEAFAGYTGSERRLEYTVIGDTVNTASRLCAWADGSEILVSASMREALTRDHTLIAHEPIRLRGRPEPVPVFVAK